ncbi:MAG: hypothetical protein ABEH59_13945 [Halobacteriales archaeon]
MATLESVTLWAHIAAGVVALGAGGVAMLSKKGGPRHRRAGRLYVRSMVLVVATVPLLLVFDPGDFTRQFLLLVAVFSGYLVFSGYRILSRKRPEAPVARLDRVVAALAVVASVGLVLWGVVLALDDTGIGIVMAVFGVIGLAFGGNDLLDFRQPDRRGPWMADHLARMIGGYIATVTAVSAVNLVSLVPEVVAWLWPTAAGVPLIIYWQGKHANHGPLADVI